MEAFERTINISVKGEKTKHQYEGTFIVKMFLTQKEKLQAVRNIKSKVGDLEALISSWNLGGYLSSISAIPEEFSEEEDALFISPLAKRYISSSVVQYLPNVPHSASMLSDIVMVNSHIISAPEWWKNANNGEDLFDEAPVRELNNQLAELILEFTKDDDDPTPAS